MFAVDAMYLVRYAQSLCYAVVGLGSQTVQGLLPSSVSELNSLDHIRLS